MDIDGDEPSLVVNLTKQPVSNLQNKLSVEPAGAAVNVTTEMVID